MSTDQIKVERVADTTVIVMERPAKHNALSPSMLLDLRMAVLEADPADYLVITSSSDIFCSGLDLDHLHELWSDQNGLEAYFGMLHDLYMAIYAHPSPTIAIVRKGALGGGFGLACCCDMILAGRNSRFMLPGNRFGNLARLARPTLMTKLESVDLEATSPIELNWESAYASGICADLIELTTYSNLKTYSIEFHARTKKRLLTSSQENFSRLCRQVRALVLESLDPDTPLHK